MLVFTHSTSHNLLLLTSIQIFLNKFMLMQSFYTVILVSLLKPSQSCHGLIVIVDFALLFHKLVLKCIKLEGSQVKLRHFFVEGQEGFVVAQKSNILYNIFLLQLNVEIIFFLLLVEEGCFQSVLGWIQNARFIQFRFVHVLITQKQAILKGLFTFKLNVFKL